MTTNGALRLHNHWWPRPGWQPGRIMLTWHLTFENAAGLHQHVNAYQRSLDGLPGLNLVPTEWLHLTVQGVGYSDETTADSISAVVDAVRAQLTALPAFDLAFGRPVILGEAIAIPPQPTEPLHDLLSAIRAGIGKAIGEDAVPTGPEQAAGFRPHLSIAYSHVDTDARPYAAALATVVRPPVTATITEATLIRQDRQLDPQWLYRWTTEAATALRSPRTARSAPLIVGQRGDREQQQ
jgi:2'-5' RNA ligase